MWRGEHGPPAFQAPVDVHASADGQVYMFRRRPNEYAMSSDEEELSILETRQMKQDQPRNVQLLEPDIKRANNLIKEQDLFALKLIKIPVQKHGLLTETFPEWSDSQEEKPRSSPSPPQDRGRGQPHLQEVTDFLMEVDNDIDKLIKTTTDHDQGFSEKPRWFGFRRQRLNRHGADWGIQWWNAVVAMLLIGIVLPIFYVIYFKTKDGGVAAPTGVLQPSNSSNASGSRGPELFHEPG
uniref:LysM, putative peptidoglycan-binding, domain containing 4 n=1 Tax=Nothobranchius pienaari TaxID=704102 RepID=A0A1A8L494_9TELE